MSKVPPRTPEREPCLDPNQSRYWDPRDLEQELLRTFHICSDCRMCVTYCGSFPLLFDAIDAEVEAGRAESVESLGPATVMEVADHCWQCKLCFIKCPYTVDEGAYELLDFPRLMLREKAQRARRDGVALVDKVLGEPQLLGTFAAGPAARVANLINEKRLVRKLAEKTAGISAEFPLPPMAAQRFSRWLADHEPLEEAGTRGEVVLFPTCYGEFNFPDVARASVSVLEKNGWSVVVPEELTSSCCGMPNLDGGDVEAAREKMRRNVAVLLPYVREGLSIVVPGPTCGYTIKNEWPLYVGSPEAAEVAGAAFDLMQFLDKLRREKALNLDFEKGFGKVSYHAACHLRAQKVAIPGARVLTELPDTEVRIVERCSAVDGTWGMKAKYYEEGARYGGKLSRAMQGDEDEELLVSDCSLAGLRVFKDLGRRTLHPVQALAEAYGIELMPDAASLSSEPRRSSEKARSS